MATKPVVAVYDALTQSYNQPIIVTHLAGASRDFISQVNDKTLSHAIDLELHHIGEWDDETGRLTQNATTHTRLVRALDIFQPKEQH